jgi:hypothetical protein
MDEDLYLPIGTTIDGLNSGNPNSVYEDYFEE